MTLVEPSVRFPVKFRPANCGLDDVAISCGALSTILAPLVTITRFAVPTRVTALVKLLRLDTPLPDKAKPQFTLFCKQSVPLSFGNNTVLSGDVGSTNPTVVVLLPERAVITLVLLPCKVNFWFMAPTVKSLPGVMASAPLLTNPVALTLPLTDRGTPILTVIELSEILESLISFAAVNLANLSAVPGADVETLEPPTPPGQA